MRRPLGPRQFNVDFKFFSRAVLDLNFPGQISSIAGNKSVGDFVPPAEFLGNVARRLENLHARVLLPSTIEHDWICLVPSLVLEVARLRQRGGGRAPGRWATPCISSTRAR